jgi:PAS domain S-box-containing protein
LLDDERQALATGKPQVSGLVRGALFRRPVVLAAIPVSNAGKPRAVEVIAIDPARFEAMLERQHFPPDWLISIVDQSSNFIVHYPKQGIEVGALASTGWRKAMQERPEGIAVHPSLHGDAILDAYAPSAYGWTVSVAIPESVVEAPVRRTLWMLLAASLGCIGLGIAVAWLIARKLRASGEALHQAAADIASERPVTARPTGVREYDEAVAAFAATSQALHARREERDRAEAALRAHEAELQAVINRTPFMLTRCGRDLRYRFVSQGFADLVGRPAQDIVGRPMVEVIGEDAFRTIIPFIAKVLNGERVETETEIPGKGGETRIIHVVSTPERDEQGEVSSWVASILDITERKQAERERQRAEAALAKSANEQAALYEFANRLYRADAVTIVYEVALDAIARTLYCGRAAVLRSDKAGAMRLVAWRGISEVFRKAIDGHSPWHADEQNPRPVLFADVERADLPQALKLAVNQEGIRALSFTPLMSSDGRLAGEFMACYETPHAFSRDQIDLALHLARRIGFALERIEAEHARQLAEQELRRLKDKLESDVETRTRERDRIWNVSEDLLGICNFEGHLISINPAWTKLLGWTEDEIKSMHMSELCHPEDAAAANAGRAQLAQGVPTVRIQNRFLHKDGSWRWIHWTMTAEDGLIYVSGRHITPEKEAAAALERAQLRSAHSQKMEALGQLTGGVAHDFNNLLMIVSGHAQSLKRRLNEQRDLRAIEAIQIASTRGEGLTRQLLSFSRSMPLNPTVVDPAEAIAAIREVLSGSLDVNTELAIDVPPDTWPVRIDKSELELALVNLTVNARDAMPNGGRLAISAANVTLARDNTPEGLVGDFVALSVADTGSGISDDVLGRVFEPFFTTKGADKGTGLGLSQVYGFAQRSGGTVVVKSQLQRGTTVTIYLPRSYTPVEMPSEEDAAHYPAPAGTTVLVVEDNHDVRLVTVSLLEQLGYRAIAVENAAAALDALAASQEIDVIFSDVVLPGDVDGLLLARMIRARYPDLPIVLTTGYAKVFDSETEFPVLRKPFQISALGRIIREVLGTGKR